MSRIVGKFCETPARRWCYKHQWSAGLQLHGGTTAGCRGVGLGGWIGHALPDAVAYATSLMGDRGQGEDIVQDCICRLLAHAARYDLARDGRKLLFRSITNACINHHTRERRNVSLDDVGRLGDGGGWGVEDTSAVTPPAAAMAGELRSAIGQGLNELPLRQRSALELSSFGYRSEEIAEMLGVAPDNVRVLLFRARRAMAIYLNARFPGSVTP